MARVAQRFLNCPAAYTEIEIDGESAASVFVIVWSFQMGEDEPLVEVAEIRDLHVLPERRCEGLGRSLVRYCLDQQSDKPLMLRVEPFDVGDTGLSLMELTSWYYRLGFEHNCPFMKGSDWLWQRPRKD